MANKEAEPVMISFEKLGELLNKKGKKWQYLRDCGISPGIVAKMKEGTGHTDTRTIQKVCEILHCQPGQSVPSPARNQKSNCESNPSVFPCLSAFLSPL